MSTPPNPTPYDTVRYPSYSHANAHIDRLAVQATLYGLDPAPLERCRVLEIGCGDGTNLIGTAMRFPGSEFVGVDLAARRIEEGRAMAATFGVDNVTLHAADIRDIDESYGPFDYVICHGVYSWVPPEVADRILAVSAARLAPQGVAFVSYLAMPGSHARLMLREALRWHVAGIEDPDAKVAAARDFASWLAAKPPVSDMAVMLLQSEASRIVHNDPAYTFHDELAEWNTAHAFMDFMAAANGHGLQFLAEAIESEMVDHLLPAELRARMEAFGGDRLRRQQYLDIVRARRFRQTLLCHAGLTVADAPIPERITPLFVTTRSTVPGGVVDLSPGVEVRFECGMEMAVTSEFPLGKAALAAGMGLAPRRVRFSDLEDRARAMFPDGLADVDSFELQEFFVTLYGAKLVDLHMTDLPVPMELGECPTVWPIARWQATRGTLLSSREHTTYQISDPRELAMIRLLDGTRSRAELEAAWTEFAPPGEDPAAIDRAASVEVFLAHLAQLDLLEP